MIEWGVFNALFFIGDFMNYKIFLPLIFFLFSNVCLAENFEIHLQWLEIKDGKTYLINQSEILKEKLSQHDTWENKYQKKVEGEIEKEKIYWYAEKIKDNEVYFEYIWQPTFFLGEKEVNGKNKVLRLFDSYTGKKNITLEPGKATVLFRIKNRILAVALLKTNQKFPEKIDNSISV